MHTQDQHSTTELLPLASFYMFTVFIVRQGLSRVRQTLTLTLPSQKLGRWALSRDSLCMAVGEMGLCGCALPVCLTLPPSLLLSLSVLLSPSTQVCPSVVVGPSLSCLGLPFLFFFWLPSIHALQRPKRECCFPLLFLPPASQSRSWAGVPTPGPYTQSHHSPSPRLSCLFSSPQTLPPQGWGVGVG